MFGCCCIGGLLHRSAQRCGQPSWSHRRPFVSPALVSCTPPPSVALRPPSPCQYAFGRRHSSPRGVAGARRGRTSRSPSSTGLRAPTPTSSFEISSPAPTEEQTDPFECCSATPCVRCVFYKSRCWATTGGGGPSRRVTRGAGSSVAWSVSASRDLTARHAASESGGGSENAGNDSDSGKSSPVPPVRFFYSPL